MFKSLLFVPGDSERKIEKAAASGADILIYDLEDSVVPDRKAEARQITRAALKNADRSICKYYVRVNSLDTEWIREDLAAVVPARPDGIVLPKCNSADDIKSLDALISSHETEEAISRTKIIAIVTETPQGVLALTNPGWVQPRLAGMMWGAEDLSAEIGATVNYDNGDYTEPFRLARNLCLIAARAAGVVPIDTVFADFRDEAGLTSLCQKARRDGFEAKAAIHPAQVKPINDAFQATPEEIEWAKKVITLLRESDSGVASLDGKMLDMPHLRIAQKILAKAESGGKS
ncbi:HpcH/HpaI aldolase/citrate lyase family protein [Aquisalinus flavus]|uniref:CoA ester lyase n=1 Tax=Aquisalinus flavus TaxID=1526572 RepID=A0A8J2Y4N0_9PROT|nr:CoA ester lyase [Aquisalinus flavus]MBD0427036.1 CoA ester lyase [Aquisalinus flavus]UNE46862.1 CoA ester lyase [Aquisalinus flavus]GGC97869.1 CoA ester lyase [Aquisalinus flavus]